MTFETAVLKPSSQYIAGPFVPDNCLNVLLWTERVDDVTYKATPYPDLVMLFWNKELVTLTVL